MRTRNCTQVTIRSTLTSWGRSAPAAVAGTRLCRPSPGLLLPPRQVLAAAPGPHLPCCITPKWVCCGERHRVQILSSAATSLQMHTAGRGTGGQQPRRCSAGMAGCKRNRQVERVATTALPDYTSLHMVDRLTRCVLRRDLVASACYVNAYMFTCGVQLHGIRGSLLC
jgi:hypothetical protein